MYIFDIDVKSIYTRYTHLTFYKEYRYISTTNNPRQNKKKYIYFRVADFGKIS